MPQEKNASQLAKKNGYRRVYRKMAVDQMILQKENYTVLPFHDFISQERMNNTRTHKGKHWVAKVGHGFDYKPLDKDGEQYYFPHKDFINECMTDSYLCHIFHQGNALAPKGKFISYNPEAVFYVSRLYPLDHHSGSLENVRWQGDHIDVRDREMQRWLEEHPNSRVEHHNVPRSKGLVESIAFNMIVSNWDQMMSNLTAYEMRDKNGMYLQIAPFDFAYSLQQKDPHQMKWNEEGFRSVVSGTDPHTGATVGVARALMETIGELGTRTTDHYRNIIDSDQFPAYSTMCNGSRDTVTAMIKNELDAMNPNDHQAALLSVFDTLLAQIAAHKETSRDWVKSNMKEAVEPKLRAHQQHCFVHYLRLETLHRKLTAAAQEFGGFVSRFRQEKGVVVPVEEKSAAGTVRRMSVGRG